MGIFAALDTIYAQHGDLRIRYEVQKLSLSLPCSTKQQDSKVGHKDWIGGF
jgi:hypothetical protein